MEYYQNDIDWFALNFIMLCVHGGVIKYIIMVHKGTYQLKDHNQIVTFETFGWGQIYLIVALLVIRLISLILMSTMRTQDRDFVKGSEIKMVFCLLLYIGVIIAFISMKDQVCNMIFGLFIMDLLIFFLQLILYKVKMYI